MSESAPNDPVRCECGRVVWPESPVSGVPARENPLEAAGNDWLAEAQLHDDTGDPYDEGFMAAWRSFEAAWRAALSGGTNQDAFLRAGGEVDTGGEKA